jgi:hypothetical protein
MCAAHQARISSRRLDGDNRVELIRNLHVLGLRQTLSDHPGTGNTQISRGLRLLQQWPLASYRKL